MKHRQSGIPSQWLIADERLGSGLWRAVRRLPPKSGVVVLYNAVSHRQRRELLARLRRIAKMKELTILDERPHRAVRIHNARELRRAAGTRTELLFLSPICPTRSHPDWAPLPRMRAATLARLARLPVIALGGMNSRRFRTVHKLGFAGWAGIDAWIRT